MFKNPLVRFSFHLSWFLLILGGSSLFEEKYWKIPGILILGLGLLVFLYVISTMYMLHKPLVKPKVVLSVSLACIFIVILARLFFGQYILSGVLGLLTLPIIIAWFVLKTPTAATANKRAKR